MTELEIRKCRECGHEGFKIIDFWAPPHNVCRKCKSLKNQKSHEKNWGRVDPLRTNSVWQRGKKS